MIYVVHHDSIDSAISTLKRDRLSHGMLNVTGKEVTFVSLKGIKPSMILDYSILNSIIQLNKILLNISHISKIYPLPPSNT